MDLSPASRASKAVFKSGTTFQLFRISATAISTGGSALTSSSKVPSTPMPASHWSSSGIIILARPAGRLLRSNTALWHASLSGTTTAWTLCSKAVSTKFSQPGSTCRKSASTPSVDTSELSSLFVALLYPSPEASIFLRALSLALHVVSSESTSCISFFETSRRALSRDA